MVQISRRSFMAGAAGSLLVPTALAQYDRYPSRPLQLTHGFGAGGNADVVSRLFAQKMQDMLKQPVVVDIKSGAGGTIGLCRLAPPGLKPPGLASYWP